jgi:hypothetical protein
MSVTVSVYLEPSRMITPEEWQRRIRAAGFDLEIDTDFDPVEFSGFLPCRYRGVQSGFEYYRDLVDEDKPHGVAGGQVLCISCVTHSLYREAACSAIAAAVLCEAVDGRYSEEGEDAIDAASALAWVRSALPDYHREMESQEAQQALEQVKRATRPWWKFWA